MHVWAPAIYSEALDALASADGALRDGYWIAGALSYEFGAQMHGVHERTSEPLLILGAFRPPYDESLHDEPFEMTAPLRRTPRSEYRAAIDAIVDAIGAGEVYQVNYTVPFDVGFRGSPAGLYAQLARSSRVPYPAYLEYGELAVISISPELFLQFDETHVAVKPMKGTAPLDRLHELSSEKNRAEHVMIVDLLRNDLHRVASRVRVDPLLETERYPTFATMTSTIRAQARAPFSAIIRATFPCGSVTGAPKRAAIQHIARLERQARGFYTGSLGFISPQRRGWWNVAIRTLQIDGHRVRFDAGGGIVSDSNAGAEWDEVLLKSRFLAPAHRDFALIETLGPQSDPALHANRLRASADAFSLAIDQAQLERALQRASARDAITSVRAGADGVTVQIRGAATAAQPVPVCISPVRVRSDDPLLAHKTNRRHAYDAAAAYASEHLCFDALLLNERGEITEGARTNVFARIGGTLYTPPLASGVLPGVLRSKLVSTGQAVERTLTVRDLLRAGEVYAGNSARGLLLARIVMTTQTLYPLVLNPKITPAIWGGHALVERFGKSGDANAALGESWECWDENTVLNGAFAGKTVAQLRGQLGAALMGDLDPQRIFPLLTKIIDAQASLSVQVHPGDAYAQRVEHQQNGKTECWFILDAKPAAELVMGWSHDASREEYERRVADGTLGEILHRVPVKAGESFYIPAGTLHAIGEGIIIFETQQASDLTYRIFDWNRVGPDGKPRELHVQKAADVLDYRASTVKPIDQLSYAYEGFQRTALIADTHFLVERVLASETAAAMQTHARPLVIMSLESPLHLTCEGGDADLHPYQTALIPAGAASVRIATAVGIAPFLCATPSVSQEMLVHRLQSAGVGQASIAAFLAQFQETAEAAQQR